MAVDRTLNPSRLREADYGEQGEISPVWPILEPMDEVEMGERVAWGFARESGPSSGHGEAEWMIGRRVRSCQMIREGLKSAWTIPRH